jgi:hypothetical protein
MPPTISGGKGQGIWWRFIVTVSMEFIRLHSSPTSLVHTTK